MLKLWAQLNRKEQRKMVREFRIALIKLRLLLISKDDLDNLICIDETQLKEDIRNLLWLLKTVKIDFKLSINEFESLERLTQYSEFKKFDGDVE